MIQLWCEFSIIYAYTYRSFLQNVFLVIDWLNSSSSSSSRRRPLISSVAFSIIDKKESTFASKICKKQTKRKHHY